MAALEIDFYCLCLFVPQHDKNTVHVLMPGHPFHGGGGVSGHEHRPAVEPEGSTQLLEAGEAAPEDEPEDGDGHPRHVVRIMDGTTLSSPREMKGWKLVLGSGTPSADTDLSRPVAGGGEIVNISTESGIRVPRALIAELPHAKVASRVVLRAGRVVFPYSDADWEIGGRRVKMAHRVTWRIDSFPDTDALTWVREGAAGDAPLRLTDLTLANGVRRIAIFHVLPNALPPNHLGSLKEWEVREHFKLVYHLIGHRHPTDRQLPRNGREIGNKSFTYNCPTVRGTLG